MFGMTIEFEEYELLGLDSLVARVSVEEGEVAELELNVLSGFTGTSVEGRQALLEQLRVAPNFPNPFSASTSISFEIPETRHVSVTVFDMLGREVATLVDGVVPAGSHAAVFNAADQPNGIYLYRVRAGDASQSGRMVLAR